MSYFSRRNGHIVEFSGYEEVSSALRKRLFAVLERYVGENAPYSHNARYIESDSFFHEVGKEFPGKSSFDLVNQGAFHEVFTMVEIFLHMTENLAYDYKVSALDETGQVFSLSGSVYKVNNRRVELQVSEDFAKRLENTKEVLVGHFSACDMFFDAVGNLVGRKAKAEDIIKDVFVAFEDYLKSETKAKEYSGAIVHLEKNGIISPTQKALLEKIYAYRSDTYGVGHAGNNGKPHETDALWFVDTVIAQLLLISRKLKSRGDTS